MGVPVFDNESEVIGTISVGGAATRLPEQYCKKELAPRIKVADTIKLNLAYD